jgi:hypothetical protein
LVAGVGRLVPVALDLLIEASAPAADPASDTERRVRELRRRARATAWRIRRMHDDAAGNEFLHQLGIQLVRLAPTGEDARCAIVAWTRLVERIVQEAERQYGSERGRGAFKAAQVRAALLLLLLDEQQVTIPHVPPFVGTLFISVAIDWTVDSVVAILNQNDLWVGAAEAAPARRDWLSRIVGGLTRIARSLQRAAIVVAVGNWLQGIIRRLLLAQHPLHPALRDAVESVRREGMPDISAFAVRWRDLAIWAAQHRREFVALVELVALAVQEAELFFELPGADKKVYARELMLAALEEYEIVDRDSPFEFAIIWMIDEVIEAVVPLFHDRGLFVHRTTGRSRVSAGKTRP